jgi:hypothetical protein
VCDISNQSSRISGTKESTSSDLDICPLNTSTGFASGMMEKIFAINMKDKRRGETLQEKTRKMSEMNSNIEQLKLLTQISSGSLGSVGKYHITADIMDVVVEDRIAKKKKEQQKEEKRKKKTE